ncbi:MAG: hypothetical protein AB1640_00830 [bacterium]
MTRDDKDRIEDSGKDQEKAEEDRKIRQLRIVADFTCWVLSAEDIQLSEARHIIAGVKRFAMGLFPGKEETFDLIYGRRFRRILLERFPLS